jgi:hypothetical protein
MPGQVLRSIVPAVFQLDKVGHLVSCFFASVVRITMSGTLSRARERPPLLLDHKAWQGCGQCGITRGAVSLATSQAAHMCTQNAHAPHVPRVIAFTIARHALWWRSCAGRDARGTQ